MQNLYDLIKHMHMQINRDGFLPCHAFFNALHIQIRQRDATQSAVMQQYVVHLSSVCKEKERTSIYIAHRRIRRKAGCQAGGPAVKLPLMRSRHSTRAAGQPGHRPQPAHTGLDSDLTVGRQRQSAVGLHLRNQSLMDYYSFNRPPRDGRLSRPCWLTDSGRFTHKVVTRPAVSLAQG